MSKESLQEEVNEANEKYERVLSEFENYKREAKELEQFLEQQSTKKQGEIRKMKEESILKEKNFKLMKNEIGQLQAENATLKAEAAKNAAKPVEDNSELINKLQGEIVRLKNINIQLTGEREEQKIKIEKLESDRIKIDSQWEGKMDYLNNALLEKKREVDNLKEETDTIAKQINNKSTKQKLESDKKIAPTELSRKDSKKQIEGVREFYDKQRQKLEQRIKKLEQLNSKIEKALRQSKSKIKDLIQQNQSLQYKLSNSMGSNMQSPSIVKQPIEDETEWDYTKIFYSCLLLTKPHYISPFLQIYEDKKLIKIYKSTRTGCFEKSMGCYKHKVDKIVFDQEVLLEPIINKILQSQDDSHHSIIFFGVKKSNKKYLMSKLLVGLKQFLIEKLNDCENDGMESIYMKRSAQQQKNYTEKANDKDSILQVIDKVISLGHKNQRKSEYSLVSSRKVVSKPKVRFFRIKINSFSLEIGTTSFTNLASRDKVNATNMLNNILYSKLPDILQSSMSQKHVILTLNPIVDLYEDCKNTLNITNCKSASIQKDDDEWRDWKNSPVKDQLNNVAKKKLQTFQRENEQTSIKIKKLQDQCVYFKHRFDQLECRLKNLLNTHQGQNSYLKKSPVTLSYQKLLKFVHSVQSRTSTNGSNLVNSITRSGFMNIDKDNESIDAL